MTNTGFSLAFSGSGSSRAHLTDALIFASRSTRCAVASMTLTEFAASMLIGLMGSRVSMIFEDLKKVRSLARRFGESELLVGEPDGKGCSPGLMWWSVVLTRVRRVSSYCGLTIEGRVREKPVRRWGECPPETNTQGTLLLAFFIGMIQSLSNDW